MTRYDPNTGAVIETRQPRSTGTDAAATATVYYTAGANAADPGCGNKPAWDGLPCTVGPKAQPGVAGLPGLPTERVTAYDYLNRATTTVESVTDAAGATQTRTSTTSYTNGGYGTAVATTALTGGLGAAVPTTTVAYATATGLIRITKHGHAAAVLMSADDLDSLHETLRALSMPGLVDELRQAQVDYADGDTVGGEDLRAADAA